MAVQRRTRRGDITPTTDDWYLVARRARALARAQLGALLLFAFLVFGLATIIGWELRTVTAGQRSIHHTLEQIEALEHEAALGLDWATRPAAGDIPRDFETFLAIGPTRVREYLAGDSTGAEPAETEIVENIVGRLEAARAAVDEFRSTPAASRRDLTPLFIDLADSLEAWIHHEQRELAEASAAISDRASYLTRQLIAAVGVMSAIIGALWFLLYRSRNRLVGALSEAAHRLSRRVELDQLTGLLGHRSFKERLDRAFDAAAADGAPLSLVLFDLDDFKNINDTYGHQFGDRVIAAAGSALRRTCRQGEHVGRLGGDEFGWILPGTTGEEAAVAAERLRRTMTLEHGIPVGSVTVSSGACDASWAKNAEDLYRLADGALYWSKAMGRDHAVLYDPSVVFDLSPEEHASRLESTIKLESVLALAKAVDARDPTTQRHSERVAQVAALVARELGWQEDQIGLLVEAALVHDVGKIGVPEAILFKRGRLTDDEYEIVKGHSLLGAQIVSGVLSDTQVAWVRGHHERMDGSGYPDGLDGSRISDGARVLALADAWDAMTGDRPYSEPRTMVDALEECRRSAGTQFCGEAVDALTVLLQHDRLPARDDRPDSCDSGIPDSEATRRLLKRASLTS